MKQFVLMFNDTLYKAQGSTISSILESMFTLRQLKELRYEGFIEIE